ncbi:MAG: hypothetical protein AAGD92_11135 [Pseudomonadota bacterium]
MKKRRYWTGTKKAPSQDKFFIGALDPDLWERGDAESWDACWHTGMPAPKIYKDMRPGQSVNHIPGNNALTVKSMLHETLTRLKDRARAEDVEKLSFFPYSYLMPDDYHALQRNAFAHPEKRWIIKPKSLSRGRGISVTHDAGTAPFDEKQLVQEYLSRPHLYDGHKYVLRCYLAITSVEPLRVYLYKEGFVKLASELYRDSDFENLYAHLTNPDINVHNKAADAPVVFHSFAHYRTWIAKQGGDADAIFEQVRNIGAVMAIGARETMRARLKATGAWAQGCYELIGMDCMVDADLKPWLLECNLSPSLAVHAGPENGGPFEEEVKSGVVSDLVAMAGLNDPDRGRPDPNDINSVIKHSEEELERAGGYERVFPAADAAEFFPFFPAPRYADIRIAGAAGLSVGQSSWRPGEVAEFVFDDDLALFNASLGKVSLPPAAGAYIWLKSAAGAAPDDIAQDLAAFADDSGESASPETLREKARQTVWDTLADWGAADMLRASGETATISQLQETITDQPTELFVSFCETICQISYSAPEITPRITDVLSGFHQQETANRVDTIMQIARAPVGYALIVDGEVLHASLSLSAVADALSNALAEKFIRAKPARELLSGGLWRLGEKTVLIASTEAGGWNSIAASCADAHLLAGSCAISTPTTSVEAISLPARASADSLHPLPDHIACWEGEKRGALIPAPSGVDTQDIDVVIIPVKDRKSTSASITRLTGREAFDALVGACVSGKPSASAAGAMAEWTNAIPVFRLRFSEVSNGAEKLANAAI